MKQAQGFLAKKKQVRVSVVLHGRQKSKPDFAIQFLNELHETYLKAYGSLASSPNEKNIQLTYNPKK